MRQPTRFQQQTIWNAVTGISILVLGALIVGLIWLLGQIFGFLQPVLIPIIVAGIIAYLLDPVVGLIERRGVSRLWSVVIVFVAMLTLATVLVWAILPGIQRGSGMLRDFIKSPAKVAETSAPTAVEQPATADAAAAAEEQQAQTDR